MNKKQIEVEKAKLAEEKKVLDALKKQYMQAADDVAKKISFHTGKIDALLSDLDNLDEVEKSILQSQIYQRKYQQSLQKQIGDIIDNMNANQYQTVEAYLKGCYETGFLGSLYDIHGQGIPIITPINQKAMVKAVTLDSKVSKKLYGSYVDELKKRIQAEVSRGVATNTQYSVIARNLNMQAGIGFNKAMRIARTEGHGVQVQAAVDVQYKAKEAGADIVKQWDSTLDGRTRESHRRVDGEIRELDEKFSNGMMFPSDSAGGAAEVVNCRCALLQRAKWALDEDELQTLKDRAAFYGLDKTESFQDFQKKYLKAAKQVSKPDYNSNKIKTQIPADSSKTFMEYYEEEPTAERLKRIKEYSGFDDEKAQDVLVALCGDGELDNNRPKHGSYFYGADTRIRMKDGEKYSAMADTIDDYITASPKYEGKIYRGMTLSKETADLFEEGGTFVENGALSSWTNKKNVAEKFAKDKTKYTDGNVKVILETENHPYSTPVQHLSVFGDKEAEVLVSNIKFSEYDIVSVKKTVPKQKTERKLKEVIKGKNETTLTEEYSNWISEMKTKYGTDDFYSSLTDAEFDKMMEYDKPVEYGGGLIVKKTEDQYIYEELPIKGQDLTPIYRVKLRLKEGGE